MPNIRVSRKLFAKYRSIQGAISDAPPGSVIEVEPGVYKEDLWIDRYIEIVGVGAKEEVIIQGEKHPAVEMATGYAVLKNITIKQGKRNNTSAVLIQRGSLVLDGCRILSHSSPAISIIENEAEPVIRRSEIKSRNNIAILVRSNGKILFEQCVCSSHSDASVVLIADGNPHFRHCTFTGNPGYGLFVEEHGKGVFEECNWFGFDYSPAIGIDGGNPQFIRCKIHDGKESGIAIHRGKGLFQECTLFGFDRNLPAVRTSNRAQPRFQNCIIKNCQGGAFLFENEGAGIIENCDLYGFIHRPAIVIRNEAHPQILRTKIHDGNKEAVLCYDSGKGIMESCQLYGFNENVVSVINMAKLDLLRCQITNGRAHGIYMAQNASGIIKDSSISQMRKKAAIYVTQAADPLFVQCKVIDCYQGAQIVENGRGTFEHCTFQGIEKQVWDIQESHPMIRKCTGDETEPSDETPIESEVSNVFSRSIRELFAEVDQIIGQHQAKQTLRELVLYLDYLQDRIQMGFKTTEPLNIHALFTGPPDTGQSKLARIYSQILKEMGLLSSGHMVTAEVPNLLSRDEITTRNRVKELLEEARGGTLYLTDLYTLTPGMWPSTSIQEFLSQIQAVLAQAPPKMAIIMAGPDQSMRKWLQSIPSLNSHLKNHFRFVDYSAEEMLYLFECLAKEEDYTIHPTAYSPLLKEMNHLWQNLSSGSRVDQVGEFFQKVKLLHSRRCSRLPKQQRTREVLTTLLAEDLS